VIDGRLQRKILPIVFMLTICQDFLLPNPAQKKGRLEKRIEFQILPQFYFISLWYSCSDFAAEWPALEALIPFAAAEAAAMVVI
jgi:hypothetical protein